MRPLRLLMLLLAAVAGWSVPLAQAAQSEWAPEPVKHDWVQLTSGEWLSGKIHSMYDDTLEFDSEKLDLLEIDWDDVKTLRSYQKLNVYLGGERIVSGQLRVTTKHLIVQGDGEPQTFDRNALVSFAPAGQRQIDLWLIKAGLSLNLQRGNTQQLDYTARVSLNRRTAQTRFLIDYIGNISQTDAVSGTTTTTTNNHRINATSNFYVTRRFFYSPINGEYYRDPFRNINRRLTIGAGLGYALRDEKDLKWEVSAGPSYLATRYRSVQAGQKTQESSLALMLGTRLDADITEELSFEFQYDIKLTRRSAGGYTHHLIAAFEQEVTKRIDFNLSLMWDRINNPAVDSQGVLPKPDDYRILTGIDFTFD